MPKGKRKSKSFFIDTNIALDYITGRNRKTVLPIVKFKTEQEAIELANQTAYGLGSYVFTKDQEKAERISKEIQSGMVSVNGANYIMPFNPFGGYKNSGFGREHGKYGFGEVTQIKIVAKNKYEFAAEEQNQL